MRLLDSINSPDDVKALPKEELDALCDELREFLLVGVSKTGGHLASNLGVVELTVAIHRVFDTATDRLIFDVGHQCYTHKILTGRRQDFLTLRQFGGLSGYPKPSESPHDAFIAGHASTSISTALGVARARTLTRGDYSVVALIGDGALTGGLSFEAMSDAGESSEPMVIILNDNGMSITRNVGGIAKYLARQRMKPSYIALKKYYRRVMHKFAFGRAIHRFTHNVKRVIRDAILKCSLFEEMGLRYAGPIDGHNVDRIVEALEWAKIQTAPTLVHVITQKGKGYKHSERSPEEYHGVVPFDYTMGKAGGGRGSFSSVFGNELCKLAGQDPRICAITASMTDGTGLSSFAATFPNRFFDVGIAEGHAATMAAGMASRGAVPIFAVYSTFLQRAFDMLIHDVAISGLHVVFAVDRAGLVSGDGETHQGVFDVAYLSAVPGMKILCPANFAELRDMLFLAVERINGPVAIRYPKGDQGRYIEGGADAVKLLRIGTDVTLVTYGISVNTACDAAETLDCEGISVEIVKLGQIAPLDTSEILRSVKKTGRLIVLEDSAGQGSVGERLLAKLALIGECPSMVTLLNTGEMFAPCGNIDELRNHAGIDEIGLCDAARKLIMGHSPGRRVKDVTEPDKDQYKPHPQPLIKAQTKVQSQINTQAYTPQYTQPYPVNKHEQDTA